MSLSNSEWKEYKLGDLADINMGQSPESKFYNEQGIGLPFLQGNRSFGPRYPLFDTFCTDPKKIAEQGEILFSVRAPVGDINIANTKICIGRGLASLRAKNGNNIFLFYLLHYLRNEIINNESGTVFGSVNRDDLDSLNVLVPELYEQRAIASILSSLDDKIDLLHRQNKTLEALAETLFRQWFFLSQKSKVKSEKFGDLVHFIKGKKPNNTVEVFIEGLVPQILIETFDTGKTLYSDPTDMVIADEKDILMVMDGASSGRVEIGMCGIVGSTIGLFRPKKDFNYPLFLFYFLKSNEDFIKENTTGSAIPHTDRALVLDLDVDYSSIEKVKEFELIVENYFNKMQSNTNQIRTLTQLRDTLLPKLMSGEVRVKMSESEFTEFKD